MTFHDLADTIDRYADDVASVGMRGTATRFRKDAAALRTDPESAELGDLYATLTALSREGDLDHDDHTVERDDDREENRIGRRLRDGGNEGADAIRRLVLSPEAYAAFQRLGKEYAALPQPTQASLVDQTIPSGILEEQTRLLQPVRDWGPSGSEHDEPHTPFVWLGTAISLLGKATIWLLGLAFVWAIIETLWLF